MTAHEPTPTGRQREVVYLPSKGHVVVLGSAGSGKSTVAVLRARYLGASELEHGGPVLLVTYTKALTRYLKQLVGPTGPQVDVLTFHEAGRSALEETGAVPLYNAMKMNGLQSRAISAFKRSHPGHRLASRAARFFMDEFAWIAGHGIEDKWGYIEAERVGRGSARLLRADRETLFSVYDSYLKMREEAGYDYDLHDMSHALHIALQSGRTKLPYEHVVIDEAQDFPPEVLRAAAKGIPDSGSLTVFADYAQQIYGHRMSWRSAGLEVSKIWSLEGNYRNTKQIAAVATAISSHPDFSAEDLVPASAALNDGPVPSLVSCSSPGSEERWIARTVQRLLGTGNIAVLARNQRDRDDLASLLPSSAQKLDRSLKRLSHDGVYYGTLHAAKGLEFDSVLIVRCSRERLPDARTSEALGLEAARIEDLRLLYVGATRARTNLFVSYTDTVSDLVPSDDGVFELKRVS